MSRRAALAIWAACLAGGVGIGVLTDGGVVGPAPSDRAEPPSEGTNLDAAGWQPPGEGETSGGAGPSREAADASAVAGGEDEGLTDRSDPPTSGPGRRLPHRSRAGGRDGRGRDGRETTSIIETIVPDIVIPPLDGQPGEPGESTTTTTGPSSTTTTSEPSSSTTTTTSSVPPEGGGGPIISPLRPGGSP